MKVLMISRATLFESPGGDTIQIVKTADFLRKLDVDVDIKLTSDMIDYEKYDLIHFFNIIRPADILYHINKTSIPFVVSTIYVNYTEAEKIQGGFRGKLAHVLSSDQIEFLKTIARAVFSKEKVRSKSYFIYGHRGSIKKIAKKASVLLPNSNSEYHRFSNDYNISNNYYAIANAVDKKVFNYAASSEKAEFKNYIVCAARIEPCKNQLNLIKAVNSLGYKLALIGKPSLNHVAYFEACKKIAGNNVVFIDHVKQENLVGIFKAAKVHVLPSWFETTGLSTLEAALMRCNVVVTKKGDTEEYFKDYAWYCAPESVNSISKAIKMAYEADFNDEFSAYILANYTWEKTAEQTLMGYKKALNIKT